MKGSLFIRFLMGTTCHRAELSTTPDVAELVDAAKGVMRHMPDHPDTAWQDLADALAALARKGGDA